MLSCINDLFFCSHIAHNNASIEQLHLHMCCYIKAYYDMGIEFKLTPGAFDHGYFNE